MEDWKEYKIAELVSMKNGKKRPMTKGKYPVFGGNGILDYADNYNAENTIIVGRVGAYCGNVYRCKGKCWVSDNAISVSAKEKVDNNYLFYLMSTLDLHHQHIGGAQPLMTQDIIGDFSCRIPSISSQQQIVKFLSSLDDKIELNRRINRNLEQQAQALFKAWFVDFEPFKDGKFVESVLGKIPQELTISKIGDIPHKIESGRRPKGGATSEGIPSIGAENIKGLGFYDYSKTKYIPKDFASVTNRGKISGYELLIYKDGGKPGYFIPNYTIFGEGFPFEYMFINEHVFLLDLMSREYNIFAYFYMQTSYIMNQLNSIGGKAAIPGINTKDVESLPIFTDDNKKVKEFGRIALPMITTILKNSKENANLTKLRDTLLPRLMSGELKIDDLNR